MTISEAVRQTPYLLGQLLEWPATRYPQRPALEWQGGSLSYRDLLERVRGQEAVMASLGASRFQRWGLLLDDIPDFLISFFALLRLGCVVSPLREPLSAEFLREDLERCRFHGLLVQGSQPKVQELAAELPASRPVELAPGRVALLLGPHRQATFSGDRLVDVDPALILWTSGSLGRARGVVLQHHAVLANMWANIRSLGYRDDDRTLLALPLSHAYALLNQCLCHLALGATVCIPPTPLVGPILCRALEDFSITTLTTVPPLLRILVEGLRRDVRSYPALRMVTVGAGRTDAETVGEFLRLVPAAQLVITYGLTEAGPRVTSGVVDAEHFEADCVGAPLPNVEVRMHAEAGTESRVVLRGRSLMRGYADDPCEEGTDHSLCTADLGALQDGKLHFHGRLGRAINRGGVLVAAEQIERVLLKHPAVKSACVEREEHPFWGEVPVAKVCFHPQAAPVTTGELNRYCAERLPVFARPQRIQKVSTQAPIPKEREMLALFQEEF